METKNKQNQLKLALCLVSSQYKKNKFPIIMIVFLMVLITICRMILPFLTANLLDEGLLIGNKYAITSKSIQIFAVNAIMIVGYVLIEHFRLIGYNNTTFQLRKEALSKLFSVKINFFFEQSATEIYSQIEQDVTAISTCFSTEIVIAFMQVFVSIGLIPTLWEISWKLTLLTLMITPLKIVKTLILAKYSIHNSKDLISAQKEYSSWLSDVINGIRLIRQFGMEQHFYRTYSEKQKKIMRSTYKYEMFQSINTQADEIGSYALNMILYILAGYYIAGNEMSVGLFLSFQMYSVQLLGLVSQFTNIAMQASAILPSFERYNKFMQEPEETANNVKSLEHPHTLMRNYDLAFDNICFAYDGQSPLFSNFSILLPEGIKVAVIGKNGSGKSTLMDLLLRYYSPQSGQILIGDVPINQIEISQYRRLFSMAQQVPFFFCDSIKNNLCLYKTDISYEQLNQIADAVGLAELIEQKGWNYCIGENGCELSGGQKQLINLGRMLILDTPIVILDETEAHVDNKYAGILQNLLKNEFKNKTVIIITHQNQLLSLVDTVIELHSEC